MRPVCHPRTLYQIFLFQIFRLFAGSGRGCAGPGSAGGCVSGGGAGARAHWADGADGAGKHCGKHRLPEGEGGGARGQQGQEVRRGGACRGHRNYFPGLRIAHSNQQTLCFNESFVRALQIA